MVNINYNGGIGKWFGGILILFLLGIVLVSASGGNEDNNFESILTYEQMDELLLSYFDGFNVTEIYNTYNEYYENNYYNITNVTNYYNEYYYYNITYLNETFNEYITNEYYEDNYYNTYNNNTYLNQTYINNEYYNTYNQYNETAFTNMMESINLIWDMLNKKQNERVNLHNLNSSILDLGGEMNCSQIEFMFKDSNILSIYDTLGLGISTQLAQVNNINFVSSFYIDNNNDVIDNNFIVEYDYIKNSEHAIETDSNREMSLTTIENISLYGSEMLFNWMNDAILYNQKSDILTILQNNVPKFQFYQDDNYLYIENLVTNEKSYIDAQNEGINSNEFIMLKFVFTDTNIALQKENGDFIMDINSNPFNSNSSQFVITSTPSSSNNNYFKSVYINSEELELISAKYVVDSGEKDFVNSAWNTAQIYLMDDSILYNINNGMETKNYEVNQTKNDYHIVFNLDRTSLANVYCRE